MAEEKKTPQTETKAPDVRKTQLRDYQRRAKTRVVVKTVIFTDFASI